MSTADTHRIVTAADDVVFITRYDEDDVRVTIVKSEPTGDRSVELMLTDGDIRRISDAIHDHE